MKDTFRSLLSQAARMTGALLFFVGCFYVIGWSVI